MDIKWSGKGLNEKGIDRKTGEIVIAIDLKLFRPAEVDFLLGDFSKARKILKWQPRITFKKLAKLMAEADLEMVKKEAEIGKQVKVQRGPY